jgi:phosphoesterase RecJ-like protein
MFEYVSNATYPQMADAIRAAASIATVSHARPDGDALGSQLAFHRAATIAGKQVTTYTMGAVETGLQKLAEPTPLVAAEQRPADAAFDLILVVDTGAWTQLDVLENWLRQHHDRVALIDHHQRGDDVARWRIIESDAAATTVLVLKLLDELRWPIDDPRTGIADALFAGLATDTGWFRYANANTDAFEVATRLMRAGVSKNRLYQVLEENHAPRRIALEARALSSVQYARQGTVAIQTLATLDFAETGGGPEDTSGLVNNPMAIGSVRVSILLTEVTPGITKVSFRSKPPLDGEPIIDVNLLAQQFGGGGHIHAAGARLNKSLSKALAVVITAVENIP